MEIRPVSLALQVGIDSRKWAGHECPSLRISGRDFRHSLQFNVAADRQQRDPGKAKVHAHSIRIF